MISFADSPFKFPALLPLSRFLDPFNSFGFGHREVNCIQCVQNNECSGGTKSFVGISRQKQHLRPLSGMICKCELYCLSKRSPRFIDQQVITFKQRQRVFYKNLKFNSVLKTNQTSNHNSPTRSFRSRCKENVAMSLAFSR